MNTWRKVGKTRDLNAMLGGGQIRTTGSSCESPKVLNTSILGTAARRTKNKSKRLWLWWQEDGDSDHDSQNHRISGPFQEFEQEPWQGHLEQVEKELSKRTWRSCPKCPCHQSEDTRTLKWMALLYSTRKGKPGRSSVNRWTHWMSMSEQKDRGQNRRGRTVKAPNPRNSTWARGGRAQSGGQRHERGRGVKKGTQPKPNSLSSWSWPVYPHSDARAKTNPLKFNCLIVYCILHVSTAGIYRRVWI